MTRNRLIVFGLVALVFVSGTLFILQFLGWQRPNNPLIRLGEDASSTEAFGKLHRGFTEVNFGDSYETTLQKMGSGFRIRKHKNFTYLEYPWKGIWAFRLVFGKRTLNGTNNQQIESVGIVLRSHNPMVDECGYVTPIINESIQDIDNEFSKEISVLLTNGVQNCDVDRDDWAESFVVPPTQIPKHAGER